MTLSARDAIRHEYGGASNFMTPDPIRVGKLDRDTVYELSSGAGFAVGTTLYGVSIVRILDHEEPRTERDFERSQVFESLDEAERYIAELTTDETGALRAKVERAFLEVLPDQDPDPSYLDQEGFEERRAAFERGDFGYVGVRACAELRFETEQGGWIGGPLVTSPGLWGIEDDSDEEYLREVGADEAAQLVSMLTALGVSEERARYAQRVALTSVEYR